MISVVDKLSDQHFQVLTITAKTSGSSSKWNVKVTTIVSLSHSMKKFSVTKMIFNLELKIMNVSN